MLGEMSRKSLLLPLMSEQYSKVSTHDFRHRLSLKGGSSSPSRIWLLIM